MNVPPIVKILSQSVYGHDHKNQITWFENVGVTPQGGGGHILRLPNGDSRRDDYVRTKAD